ncbi:hypothetical protein STSO111631_22295 [Stackebrandtia soli]
MGGPVSRRIATCLRAARSVMPSFRADRSAVMPGAFWISSSASSPRAVGLASFMLGKPLQIPEVNRPE